MAAGSLTDHRGASAQTDRREQELRSAGLEDCADARSRPSLLRRSRGPDDRGGRRRRSPAPTRCSSTIAATALNRADLLQRMGLYPDPRRVQPEIPGMEFAGTVAAVGRAGHDVEARRSGDGHRGRRRVRRADRDARTSAAGGARRRSTSSTRRRSRRCSSPRGMRSSLQGGLTSGRWALVHAGASGVGTAAIQIAKAIGARIAVTCSAGKAAACRRSAPTSSSSDRRTTGSPTCRTRVPHGFDVVLDVIGGDEVDRNLQAVAPKGHDRAGRADGRRRDDGQRRAAARQAGDVGRHDAARHGRSRRRSPSPAASPPRCCRCSTPGALRPGDRQRLPVRRDRRRARAHGERTPTPARSWSASRGSSAARLLDVERPSCASRWRRRGRDGRPRRSACSRSCRWPGPGRRARPAWRPTRTPTAATCRR